MVRLNVAVIAGYVVETSYLPRLSHFAKLLENPMNRGQRYVRIAATNGGADLVATGMLLGGEQGFDDCQPLRRDRNSLLAAASDEITQSLDRVPLMPPSIHQSEFAHKRFPADINAECS